MANKNFWMGMLVIVLAFGMTAVGCDNDPANNNTNGTADIALNGTWIGTGTVWEGSGGYEGDGEVIEYEVEYKIKFNNGNYEISVDDSPSEKGIYTTSEGKISFKQTHYHNSTYLWLELESKWYTKKELLEILPISEEEFSDFFHENKNTADYAVSGKTLILWETTFTKK